MSSGSTKINRNHTTRKPVGSPVVAAASSSSPHILPPEESLPDEDPPPYTPEAEPGLSVPGMSNIPPYLQEQLAVANNIRRQSHSGSSGNGSGSTQNQNHSPQAQIPRPPVRPPQAPPRPVSSSYPGTSNYSYGGGSASSNSNMRYNQQQQQQAYGRPAARPTTRPSNPYQLPFTYPPGYYCPKCNNTGRKLKNGLTCQDCYGRFAHQSGNVQVIQTGPPGGYGPFGGGFFGPSYVPTSIIPPGPYGSRGIPPRVVRPGDPAIGGVLCGRCRGRGLVWDFLIEDTCPTCQGIGRLL